MKNKTSKILAVVGAGVLALATQSVFADPFINGGISFSTSDSMTPFTMNGGPLLAGATAFTSFNDPSIFVSSASGSYAPTALYGIIPVGLVTFFPFSFVGHGATATPDAVPLWSFTDAGITYSFLTSTLSAVYSSTPGVEGQWAFGGTGTATATGFSNTTGTWTMTASESISGIETAFNWDSTATASGTLPDGGLTVALLGGTFVGLGVLRRKLGK